MSLIDRVKNILLKPREEWLVINGETKSGMPLITSFLVPLAVAAAIATFIGYAFIFRYASFSLALARAVVMLIQLIISVYLTAFVTDVLAPSFASEKNMAKSVQLVVYAATPAYVGALLNIFPFIGWLGSLAGGIYSLYLFYIGLPVLKKTPEDKVPIYLIVLIIALFIIYAIIGYILMRTFFTAFGLGAYSMM